MPKYFDWKTWGFFFFYFLFFFIFACLFGFYKIQFHPLLFPVNKIPKLSPCIVFYAYEGTLDEILSI